MTTTWKSSNQKPTDANSANQSTTTNSVSANTLSSWSRQQKFAMLAGFGILGLLLAASACSKQSPKPALVAVSAPSPVLATLPPSAMAPVGPNTTPAVAPTRKTHKLPANVTYSDPNSGISFLYPRKFSLSAGERTEPQLTAQGDVPMNFAQPGGVAVATVAIPANAFPGTDFASAFFNVNVNRRLTDQECSRFSFVDTRNSDGEPVGAEKVKVGSTAMEKTSTFSASALTQSETQFYHSYENGACYEYVLGVATAGYGDKQGLEPIDREQVFARLEKILETVKTSPAEQAQIVKPEASGTSGKE